jgi:hypothetical protein
VYSARNQVEVCSYAGAPLLPRRLNFKSRYGKKVNVMASITGDDRSSAPLVPDTTYGVCGQSSQSSCVVGPSARGIGVEGTRTQLLGSWVEADRVFGQSECPGEVEGDNLVD